MEEFNRRDRESERGRERVSLGSSDVYKYVRNVSFVYLCMHVGMNTCMHACVSVRMPVGRYLSVAGW